MANKTVTKGRGRPKNSVSTQAVLLSDLVEHLPEGSAIMVGTKWLKQMGDLLAIEWKGIDKTQKEVQDPRQAEPRERLEVKEENLDA